MQKKYIVRLTDAERATLEQVVKKLKGSSQKVRRAQILLKADADGPALDGRPDRRGVGCRRQTVENLRERLVTEGFEAALNGKVASSRRGPKCSTATQEAKVIAMRLGPPPTGLRRTGRCGCWPTGSWNWRSCRRSATRRCGGR